MQRVILVIVVCYLSLSCKQQGNNIKMNTKSVTMIEIAGYVKTPCAIEINLGQRVTINDFLEKAGGAEDNSARAEIVQKDGAAIIIKKNEWDVPLVEVGIDLSKVKYINIQGR